jgi:hypothetical protein
MQQLLDEVTESPSVQFGFSIFNFEPPERFEGTMSISRGDPLAGLPATLCPDEHGINCVFSGFAATSIGQLEPEKQ